MLRGIMVMLVVVWALVGCGSPPAGGAAPAVREKPVTVIVPQTVVAPQTVVVRETVAVPQTVIVKQTVVAPAPAATTGPTRTLAPTVAPTGTSAPLALTGKGQQATAKFDLPAGLVVFDWKHDGKNNFIVYLIDDQGQNVGLVANGIGAVEGSKALRVNKAGRYLFDVSADGNWSVRTR